MMKIQHYSYTRGVGMDYGTFVMADNLPHTLEDKLKKQVQKIRRVAEEERALGTPYWLLIKEKDVIVWGVCCMNFTLSAEKNTDHVGRGVYGLFAVVISDFASDSVRLPYDLNYFKALYATEIAPAWNQTDPHSCHTPNFMEGNYTMVGPFHNSHLLHLNTDPKICRSLGNADKENLLSAALTLDRVSLLIDNVAMAQATLPEAPFMNCLSASLPERDQTIRLPDPPKPRRSTPSPAAMQNCPQCGVRVSQLESEGYCTTCKVEIEKKRKEEEKMIKKLEKELQCATHRIQEQEQQIVALKAELNRNRKRMQLLSYLALALLVGLLSTCDFNIGKKSKWGSALSTEEVVPTEMHEETAGARAPVGQSDKEGILPGANNPDIENPKNS